MRTRDYRQTLAGKQASKVAGERQRVTNAVKVLARQMVAIALRMGILKKTACGRCGEPKNVEAHHRDYMKPLEVDGFADRAISRSTAPWSLSMASR